MKEKILQLRAEGKSYREIKKILGCSSGTISYHCGENQKEKTNKRNRTLRAKQHPFIKKLSIFKSSKYKNRKNIPRLDIKSKKLLYIKIITFHRGRNNMITESISFTVEQVIEKFGKAPKCYITGDNIDINKPRTYQFDHIIPKSRGGQNNLDNLGLCTAQANRSKYDMTPDEFINFCKKVVENNGYECKKPPRPEGG